MTMVRIPNDRPNSLCPWENSGTYNISVFREVPSLLLHCQLSVWFNKFRIRPLKIYCSLERAKLFFSKVNAWWLSNCGVKRSVMMRRSSTFAIMEEGIPAYLNCVSEPSLNYFLFFYKWSKKKIIIQLQ